MKRILIAAVLAGMTGGAYAVEFSDLAVKAADLKALAVADGITVPAISKGYIEPVETATSIKWVSISGGKFTMGTTSIERGFENAKPIREVAIKTFDMSKTAVTVAQYAECVIEGGCTEPGRGDQYNDYCNWGKTGRQLHPVNCVDWDQANQYARYKGARLPSESEWEYAATSGGKNQRYPWGNDEPTCDKTVYDSGYSCGVKGTMPVCSKPAGNTAQGLCDMAGNVWQWVQDKYERSYKGAPVDGSAFEDMGSYGRSRVVRGGSYYLNIPRYLRADYRYFFAAGYRSDLIGFRLVRSSR